MPVLMSLVLALLTYACASAATSETEIRVTHPSILKADIVDDQGRRLQSYEVGSPSSPMVRAVVGGFTPVREVYVVTETPHREISMRRQGYKVFELPIAAVLEAGGGLSGAETLRVRVVAVDIEGDETETDDIVLPVVGGVAH